jgi:hypothetical protein
MVPGGTSTTPRLVYASPDARFGPFTHNAAHHAIPRQLTASLASPSRETVARLRVAAELFMAGRANGAPLAPLRAQLESLVTGYSAPPRPGATRFADRQRRRIEERLLLLAPSVTGHELTLGGALGLGTMPEREFQDFAATFDPPPPPQRGSPRAAIPPFPPARRPTTRLTRGPPVLLELPSRPTTCPEPASSPHRSAPSTTRSCSSARLLLLPRPASARLENVADMLRSLAGRIDTSASVAPSEAPSDSEAAP